MGRGLVLCDSAMDSASRLMDGVPRCAVPVPCARGAVSSSQIGRESHIREGPTIADVYIDISPFYGMAPATVSGYRSGGRRYA